MGELIPPRARQTEVVNNPSFRWSALALPFVPGALCHRSEDDDASFTTACETSWPDHDHQSGGHTNIENHMPEIPDQPAAITTNIENHVPEIQDQPAAITTNIENHTLVKAAG